MTEYLVISLMLLLCFACRDEENDNAQSSTRWHEYTVAVVLPMEYDTHWKRVLEWASDNIQTAFRQKEEGIKLNFEWYDETSAKLAILSYELAERDDVIAVIGAQRSKNAESMLQALSKRNKPLFTLATSAELVRANTNSTLWAMTETDITQCEILLAKALYYGAKSVALLSPADDDYGKTFIDWFAFQAEELGMKVQNIYQYSDGTLESEAKRAATSDADFVICTPSDYNDVVSIAEFFGQSTQNNVPRLLYSDTAYEKHLLTSSAEQMEGIEGVTYGSNPESGFDVSYRTYFADDPIAGESQVYDAALLITYATWLQMHSPNLTLNEALRKIVDGKEQTGSNWLPEGITPVIESLANGGTPDVCGASGSLNFDARVYTNVLSTTYYHFRVSNGNYIILDYNSADDGKRTDDALAGWNRKIEQMQEFEENDSLPEYPALGNKWAVLIAGSENWEDYRHQADALAMYQLLKTNGYDDEHIILIMEDNISYNEQNNEPGVIRVKVDGRNLYNNVKVDYHLTQLNPTDIADILLGNMSERTPHVISPTPNDNVLLFWSGHGLYKKLCWGNTDEVMSSDQFSHIMRQMSDEGKFRKILCLIETCYSGSIMEECVGIPGLLSITSAGVQETSKADIYNNTLGIWMSNQFTITLFEALLENRSISIRDLYYKLFINTVGSHVTIYNHKNYGNIYISTMEEYL